MLVTAVIIEMGFVSDPEKADAVCALLVAAFILVGALNLFIHLNTAVKRQRRKQTQEISSDVPCTTEP